MKTKNKIKRIVFSLSFASILTSVILSCATTETKILEEKDPIVKKLEERDSIRIIKSTPKPKVKKEQTTNNR